MSQSQGVAPAGATATITGSGPLARGLFSAFAIALGLSVIAGFLSFLREPPSPGFHAEWGALVFFCCAAGFLAPVLPRRFAVSTVLLILPGALAAVLALQAALGMYAYWQTPAIWIGYLLLAVLALVLGQGIRAAGLASETVSRIAWALVIAALLNCGTQIIQAIRQEEAFAPFVVRLLTCRPYGNLGQSNQAATLAWLGLASTVYLHGRGRLPSLLMAPMVAVLMAGAALSASRMSWLFLAVCVAMITLLPAWPAGDRRARVLTAAMLGLGFMVASLGAATVLESLGAACVSGLERLGDRTEGGVVIRFELWRQAINVWLTSPWLGVGAYGFAPTVYATETLDIHRPLDIYPHSAALQILAEFGIVGAGALALVLLVALRWLVRARKLLDAPDALLLLLLAIIGTHAMLEFPLWYTYFLLLFCLAAGLVMRPEWSVRVSLLPLRVPVLALAVVLLAAAGWVFDDYRKLDRLYWLEEHRRVFSAAPTAEVRALFDGASADVVIFRMEADHIAGLSEPINNNDLRRKIDVADHLLRQNPQPITVGRRIALAILDHDEETARWHLRRLLGFFPGHAEIVTAPLRQFVEHRPEEFAVLGPMIDEELARRPKARW